ncbi:hypothetical protein ScPMuIL_017471 [Solemya velum]
MILIALAILLSLVTGNVAPPVDPTPLNCTLLGPKWISPRPEYPSYSCYKFSGKEHDWYKANARCMDLSQGMRCSLVRIETSTEDDWLTGKMRYSKGNRWIWLRRFHVDCWQWLDSPYDYVIYDGQPTFHYNNFSDDEPNNHESHGEDCGSKVRRDDGRWHDFPCENTQKFICECRPFVLVQVTQIYVGIGVDVVDASNYVDEEICEFGFDYDIIDGQLVVSNNMCLGTYSLYYL